MNNLNNADSPDCPASSSRDLLTAVIPYALPFIVYMVFTSLEPSLRDLHNKTDALSRNGYPVFYLLKILLTAGCLIYFFKVWKTLCRPVSRWGLMSGAAGAVVWIALAQPIFNPLVNSTEKLASDKTPTISQDNSSTEGIATAKGEESEPGWRKMVRWISPPRSGFNPNNHPWGLAFFAIRMAGLVLIVPVIEELFLRGFLLRYVCAENWESISFGTICPAVWILSVVYPVLTHPEYLAGIVWFTGMTALAWKTKSLTDCIVAHALTNAALGLWVLYSGQWGLL